MPFTPLHMGPGMLIKGVLGKHFSLVTFGVTQIAMDIEPLWRMIRGDMILHGPSHTYAGATGVALLVMLVAKPLCTRIVLRWHKELSFHKLHRLVSLQPLTFPSLLCGAVLGSFSHVLLDSLMHVDIRPLAPWSQSNVLQSLVTNSVLHQACLITALLGGALWIGRTWRETAV